jgi:lipoprotein-anchoring transpeptidase ErfK/SrfK
MPLLFVLAMLAAGCNDTADQPTPGASSSPSATPTPADPAPANLTASVARLNQAAPPTRISVSPAIDPFAIRAEVLLARVRFSPGVVDGQWGTNLQHAVGAYQSARSLPVTGRVDAPTWAALQAEAQGGRGVAHVYTITPADVAGPFAADVGEDFVKLAALPGGPGFTTLREALAERFHMSQSLLSALNPGVNFATAGQSIVVVDDAHPAFAKGDVARVDVAKSDASVRAYDRNNRLIAFYPATVGSTDRPSPSGDHKVVGVALDPTYTYDPAKLAWGPRDAGRLVVKSGPNNPVGSVWIDLDAPSYGLHGTANPDTIGKTASHGCVRLTNWDARALAVGVRPGVMVRFIGERNAAA